MKSRVNLLPQFSAYVIVAVSVASTMDGQQTQTPSVPVKHDTAVTQEANVLDSLKINYQIQKNALDQIRDSLAALRVQVVSSDKMRADQEKERQQA